MLHTVKNLLFYIGLFLFIGGIFNVLFDLIPNYKLTITYISYGGLYLMLIGSAYPPNKNKVKEEEEEQERKEETDIEE